MKTRLCAQIGAIVLALMCSAAGALAVEMIRIAPGTYMMGCPPSEAGREADETLHSVTLTHAFEVQPTEVTNQQYAEMAQWAYDRNYVTVSNGSIRDNMGGSTQLLKLLGASYGISFNNGIFSCSNPTNPVAYVTWYGAAAYCDWLSLQQGYPQSYSHSTWQCNTGRPYSAVGFRLPTEAEWEYACRAGSSAAFTNGAITYPDACAPSDPRLNLVGWYCGNSGLAPHPVAQRQPNNWGLYDTHGNLWEWCNDWYVAEYGGTAVDPVGPNTGSLRILRGGNFGNSPGQCRCAVRHQMTPSNVAGGDGFRIVRSAGGVSLLESQSNINPAIRRPGETFQANYFIYNTGAVAVSVGLGCSVKQMGTANWIDDQAHDVVVTIAPNSAVTESRVFEIPVDAAPGSYEVWYALRDPNYSSYFDQFTRGDLTVAEPDCTVRVTVRDAVGAPIAGAAVFLMSGHDSVADNALTIGTGIARLTAPAAMLPSEFYVVADALGYKPSKMPLIQVDNGSAASNCEIKLATDASYFSNRYTTPRANFEIDFTTLLFEPNYAAQWDTCIVDEGGNVVPAFVAEVGRYLEHSLDCYTALGFLDAAAHPFGGRHAVELWTGDNQHAYSAFADGIKINPKSNGTLDYGLIYFTCAHELFHHVWQVWDTSLHCTNDWVDESTAQIAAAMITKGPYVDNIPGRHYALAMSNMLFAYNYYSYALTGNSAELFGYCFPPLFFKYLLETLSSEVLHVPFLRAGQSDLLEVRGADVVRGLLGQDGICGRSVADVDDFLHRYGTGSDFNREFQNWVISLLGVRGHIRNSADVWGYNVGVVAHEFADFVYPAESNIDYRYQGYPRHFMFDAELGNQSDEPRRLTLGGAFIDDLQIPQFGFAYIRILIPAGCASVVVHMTAEYGLLGERQEYSCFSIVQTDGANLLKSDSSAECTWRDGSAQIDLEAGCTEIIVACHNTMGGAIRDPEIHVWGSGISQVDDFVLESDTFRVSQNKPNPFNPLTMIRYELPDSGPARMAVFDLTGRLIRSLVDASMPAGSHDVVWDGRDSEGREVSSGSYLARLEFRGRAQTVRMILLR